MQETLGAIIGENQSVAAKTEQYYTFSIIRDVMDLPYKSNLAVISLNFCELFTE